VSFSVGPLLLLWFIFATPVELPDETMPVPPSWPAQDKMLLPATLPVEFVQIIVDA
jgi:hypothetical protein